MAALVEPAELLAAAPAGCVTEGAVRSAGRHRLDWFLTRMPSAPASGLAIGM